MPKFLQEASTIKQSGRAGKGEVIWLKTWMFDTRGVTLRVHITHGGNEQRICGAEIRAYAAVDWAKRWEPRLMLTCLSTEVEMKGRAGAAQTRLRSWSFWATLSSSDSMAARLSISASWWQRRDKSSHWWILKGFMNIYIHTLPFKRFGVGTIFFIFY